jgi:hypothetical protein
MRGNYQHCSEKDSRRDLAEFDSTAIAGSSSAKTTATVRRLP